MHIWMSNSQTVLVYERVFFATVCNNLIHHRGARRVAKRFQSLATLSALPWLDQPRFLDPTKLIVEIREAWDELWKLRAHEIVVEPATDAPTRRTSRNSRAADHVYGEEMFGRYLAKPLHELALFAASAGANVCLRAGTHRELIVGHEGLRSWRIIRGDLSGGTLALAAESEQDWGHPRPSS